MGQGNRSLHPQRVLNLGKHVCLPHEFPDLGIGRVCHDFRTIGYVRGGFPFRSELAIDVNFHLIDVYSSLGGFAIDVIAIACGECKEKQLAAVRAGAEPGRLRRNDDRVV